MAAIGARVNEEVAERGDRLVRGRGVRRPYGGKPALCKGEGEEWGATSWCLVRQVLREQGGKSAIVHQSQHSHVSEMRQNLFIMMLAGLFLLQGCHRRPAFLSDTTLQESRHNQAEATLICPTVAKGWLENFTPADLAINWLLEIRRDGSLRWSHEPLDRTQLADRLQEARPGIPHPRLLVKLERGIDCNILQDIKEEVERNYGCDEHQCLFARPALPKRY